MQSRLIWINIRIKFKITLATMVDLVGCWEAGKIELGLWVELGKSNFLTLRDKNRNIENTHGCSIDKP